MVWVPLRRAAGDESERRPTPAAGDTVERMGLM